MIKVFLPPKFAKVMFSQVSVYPRGGLLSVSDGGVGVCHTHWADTPCPVHARIHTPCPMHAGIPFPPPTPGGCCGIRSASGRYASHWNAFFFLKCYTCHYTRPVVQTIKATGGFIFRRQKNKGQTRWQHWVIKFFLLEVRKAIVRETRHTLSRVPVFEFYSSTLFELCWHFCSVYIWK